jgi:hypothetical protein
VSFGVWAPGEGDYTPYDTCAPYVGICDGDSVNPGAHCTSANEIDVCRNGNLDYYTDGWCDATNNWDDYGVLWGDDGDGNCIIDDDDSDGYGRFPERHGIYADEGFRPSEFVRDMWDEYMGSPPPVDDEHYIRSDAVP